jgi:DNA (cytosine-5)-methyltransferase 1
LSRLKFIDLYAGLGGFHQALSKLGHDCVWASEYNQLLRDLYKRNYPETPEVVGDIFKVDLDTIPDHDLICGGFPCQPFSRAGSMQGFNDKARGNHFFRILEIIDSKPNEKKPGFLLLENVETILKHDNGRTYKLIVEELTNRGYEIDQEILSPHEFNIPQHRRRLFIVGKLKSRGGLSNFRFPDRLDKSRTTIESILDPSIKPFEEEKLYLTGEQKVSYDFWKGFVENFPKDKNIMSLPLWSHEWGANYPFDKSTPHFSPLTSLVGKRGTFGIVIPNIEKDEILEHYIPRYSQNKVDEFPNWKRNHIKKNRDFYSDNNGFIDEYLSANPQFRKLNFSSQKFEWCCAGAAKTFEDKLIQFRPSGLRVKLNNWAPALTTVRTQNLFIPRINRKLSHVENAKLQSLELKYLPDIRDEKFHSNGGFKAIGNAVNSEVVRLIAYNLLQNE